MSSENPENRAVFLTYGVDGWTEHETAEEARKAFLDEVAQARADASFEDEWPDHAEALSWGEYVPRASATLVEVGGAEEDGSGEAFDLEVRETETDSGPPPWRDGDERCHCTGCQWCGRLYPTHVFSAHAAACPARAAVNAVRERLGTGPAGEGRV